MTSETNGGPEMSSGNYDVFGRHSRRMCLSPVAWYMTNGRLGEVIQGSGSPRSALKGQKRPFLNFWVFRTEPKRNPDLPYMFWAFKQNFGILGIITNE